jgi:hypothetical protein
MRGKRLICADIWILRTTLLMAVFIIGTRSLSCGGDLRDTQGEKEGVGKLKCQHCGDEALDSLCPSCASMVRAHTIEQTREEKIRRDERERIALKLAFDDNKCKLDEDEPDCEHQLEKDGNDCYVCWLKYLESPKQTGGDCLKHNF